MLKDNEIELDNQLNLAGYDLVDPVFIYLANARDLTYEQAVSSTMSSWPPLATQIEVWAKGGIGSDRIAIMERCQKPKTSLLGRSADVPAGTSFVAIDEDIAMIHAIEVSPDARRKGVGRNLIQGAATWCVQKGAKWLCLAVTQSNGPANDLYRSLKMTEACSYHYRRAQSVNL
ncbi:MAG: GNAT family N-acetyltransferase [Pseudomonadota bacterium]